MVSPKPDAAAGRGGRLLVMAVSGLVLVGIAAARFAGGQEAGTAVAEESRGAAFDPFAERRLSDEQRQRLYGEVAREAELLSRYGRLVRKVTTLVQPTVVHIDTKKPSKQSRRGEADEDESGSGVITTIDGRTVVLTNRHVIHQAALDDITIRLDDGRQLTPKRVWSDAATDVGVLEVEGNNLVTARFAEAENLEIGDTVLAIGSPFGLAHSVTQGIVSAKGRRDLDLGDGGVRFQDFIQTDAAINPGNSGGPLVNLRGEVVGLNTAIASNSGGSEGIGFAIPVAMVRFVAEQLVETGRVSRAYLGVTLDRLFTQRTADRLGLTRPLGARVSGITKGGPADAVGIGIDDVILEYEGTPVDDDDHLVSLVSMTPAGSRVQMVVFRKGRKESLDVPLGSREAFDR